MWTSTWKWAKENRLFAGIIVLACILALGGVADGWSARRVAARYSDYIKGWQQAYNRDTEASKKKHEEEIRVLTADRDLYRKRWEEARGKMGRPWSPPANAKALQERFNRLGYRGTLK